MIDTHCHLLAGLDDGPRGRPGSVALARALYADGVRIAVATPHVSRRYPTSPEAARAAHRALLDDLAAENIPLRVELAAEISPAVAVQAPSDLERHAVGGHWVLVELESRTSPGALASIAAELSARGLGLLVAHPERCRAVRSDPRVLTEVLAAGAAAQVVAPSLLGINGEDVAACAWMLVRSGVAGVLASDAHDLGRRRPLLGEAARLVASRLGAGVAGRLVDEGPRALLAGRQPSGANSP